MFINYLQYNFYRYTCEDVLEIINRLKTKASISAIELNQLKNTLLDEPHNIELLLGVHGAIRGIVGQLTGIKIHICNLSCNACKFKQMQADS